MIARQFPRSIPLAGWVLVLALAQGALDSSFLPEKVPDLLLLFVVFLGIRFETAHSLFLGFLLGVFRDGWNLSPMGMTSMALVLAGYLPHRVRTSMNLGSLYARWLLLLTVTVAAGLIRFFVYWGLGEASAPNWSPIFLQLLSHSVLFAPLFAAWERTLVLRPEGKPKTMFLR